MNSFMPGKTNIVNFSTKGDSMIRGDTNTQQLYVNAFQGGNKRFRKFKRPTMTCIFCGMNGHTIERCYKKHGYPSRLQIQKQKSW